MRRFITIWLTPLFLSALPYEINFVGIKDESLLKSMFDVSNLVILQDRPPASINGLRYRVAADIPPLLKVLRAYGYYDATIKSEVKPGEQESQVFLYITPGKPYTLSSYQVFHGDCTQLAEVVNCPPFSIENLGLEIGGSALSVRIVNAELQILANLANCGYPLASIEKRRVEVDMADKSVSAAACIEEGPLSKFGPISITGLNNVDPRFITRRLAWEEGEIYNTDALELTQKRLLNSNLFSSAFISHEGYLDQEGGLPLRLRITEAKHKLISLGVYYATIDGPGGTFAWTHRNLRGMGESISLSGDFSKRYLAGLITYKKPDFIIMDQTLRAIAELAHERIHPYIAFTYRLANYLERIINPKKNVSFGLKVEHINVSRSASNGSYLLLGLPLFGKYNTADNLLNPTTGYSLTLQVTPFQSLWAANQRFIKQRLTGQFYLPVFTKKLILATRVQLGTIAGARRENIPLPKLFLGGSEDDLRGYRYLSVSPLNDNLKPLGGRSAVFITTEARIRFTETIGIVTFADLGTVSLKEFPEVSTKWFKSVGAGLRYYTFFGPIRVDIGFPLDKRKDVDPNFQIYASVGQTF